MSEHTPGPWEWDSDGHIYREPWTEEADPAICKVNIHVSSGEANARLIAAAPDLLAACIEFVRKCECGEARSKRSYAQMKDAISRTLAPSEQPS